MRNLKFQGIIKDIAIHKEVPVQNSLKFDSQSQSLYCEGEWNLAHLAALEQALENFSWPKSSTLKINGKAITKMDTAGAWLIHSWEKKLTQEGLTIQLDNFSEQHTALLSIVKKRAINEADIPTIKTLSWVAKIGKNVILMLKGFQEYLAFIGRLTIEALGILFHPKHIRWNALASSIDKTGFKALPIIALLSFMIGVVITYQMGLQLRTYGANIFIVNLLGLSVLREFGPLITAIMVAGRTGSAFTAQLGIMKLNQEIDALDTMGVTSGELLILPRILGLLITLPLLTVWADIFGVFGGMVMSNNMLGISWEDFLLRFQHEIPVRALIIGLGKAPIFALLIASIGCFQGMQVRGSADSVGENTTRSVVLGIFFIIVADAIFSIIFSKLKL
jgi:phospholipid/cholesterol/gamma-HCH transport system permease protein